MPERVDTPEPHSEDPDPNPDAIEDDVLLWEIRDSGIHHRGVFAATDIPSGCDIIQYLGERLTHDEADERGLAFEEAAKKQGIGAVYLFTLDDDWVLDGNFEGNPARLINHSCEPNCEAVIYGEGEEAEIWIVSIKDIEEGEELSFDYGFDIDNYEEHPCQCGARRCAGYIVGADYRKELAKLLNNTCDETEAPSSEPSPEDENSSNLQGVA